MAGEADNDPPVLGEHCPTMVNASVVIPAGYSKPLETTGLAVTLEMEQPLVAETCDGVMLCI